MISNESQDERKTSSKEYGPNLSPSTKEYIDDNVILKNVQTLLFNIEFKQLYDFSVDLNNTSPEPFEIRDLNYDEKNYQLTFLLTQENNITIFTIS